MLKKVVSWSARVIMILAILFMFMFSLDVFDMPGTIWNKLGGFLMHNIPVLILAVFLILAWFKELLGGIGIVLASLVMIWRFHTFNGHIESLIVIFPFLLAGVLFILNSLLGNKK